MINGIELETFLAFVGWAMFAILFLFGVLNKDTLQYARKLRKKADLGMLDEIADTVDIIELRRIIKQAAFQNELQDATGQGAKPEKREELVDNISKAVKSKT